MNKELLTHWAPVSRARECDVTLVRESRVNDTLVDVLIPTLNAGETLQASIESIQRQNINALRIVVIDDGSTDETPLLLTEMARQDPRIEVLRKPNSGIVDALNAGIERCRSEFIARHDADDVADPNRFAEEIAYLRTHSDCVAVSGAARHVNEHGQPIGTTARGPEPEESDPTRVPSHEPYMLHPFLMLRRSAMDAVGGYRHAYHSEDTDLYWRLQEIGRLHNLDTVLGDYRMHSQSITSASVLNGRISALNSQLAGISALRRRAGRKDIVFPRERLQQFRSARSLAAIFSIGARGLEPQERNQLKLSLAAKLLELSSYRPYELDEDDCRFIRDVIKTPLSGLTADDRAQMRRQISGTAARLAHKGRFVEAAALLQTRDYPIAAMRFAYRLCVPQSVRRLYGQMRNRTFKY